MSRFALVFLFICSLAGPALAQNYPPGAPTIGVSDSVVVPCTTITVTGSNWQAGSTVEITLDGAVLTNDLADADGNVSVRVTHHRCAAWQRD